MQRSHRNPTPVTSDVHMAVMAVVCREFGLTVLDKDTGHAPVANIYSSPPETTLHIGATVQGYGPTRRPRCYRRRRVLFQSAPRASVALSGHASESVSSDAYDRPDIGRRSTCVN